MQKQLAQSYTPKQEFKNIYTATGALQQGTVFGDLHVAAGTEGKKLPRKKDDELLLTVQEYGFAALDMQLYLDVNPSDKDAIKEYNALVSGYNAAKEQFEKQNGSLRNFVQATDDNNHTWVKSPWPWD